MLKKTTKQRIALVAVSALTAGVLSVVAAPAANAAVAGANKFALSTLNSSTGNPVITADGGDTTADKNVGFVAVTSADSANQEAVAATSRTLQSSAAGTANMLASGKLVVSATGGAATDAMAISVSGGTLSSGNVKTLAISNTTCAVGGASATVVTGAVEHGLVVGQVVTVAAVTKTTINGTVTIATVPTVTSFTFAVTCTAAVAAADTGTVTPVATYNGSATAYSRASAENPSLAVVVTPNVDVTSMTISAYKGAGITAAAPTNGTLLGQWVVTIVSASVSGVLSVADSAVYIAGSQDRGTVCSTAPTFDNLARNDDRKVACIYVSLVDAYGVALGAKTVSASATNSAKVEVGSAASDAYTASGTFDSGSITATGFISVIQPTLGTAASSAVTVSVDGVILGTKTINWNGVASTIELDTANSVSTFAASGATAGTVPAGSLKGIVYRIKDAAGNIVTFADQPTIADATGAMIAAQLSTTNEADTAEVVQSISAGKGLATMFIANSAVTGDGTYKLSITNSAGTIIKSAVYNAKVVGSVSTFVASLDKASYAPGEIATLTIKGLDSAGRGAADGTLLGTGTVISVNTDGFGHLTSTCETTPATSSAFLGGQKTCKFAVKNTPGSYSYSVKVASSTSQAETTGTLAVVASSATVSNADVLKSIVALIASINKQIQALQKLILKR